MCQIKLTPPSFSLTSGHLSVIPNCQFRSKTSRLKTFTANQLDEIKDPSGLFYILPFQKVWEPPRPHALSLCSPHRFCVIVFLYSLFRVIWSTGTSRGKCGTTCLERRCLRLVVFFPYISGKKSGLFLWKPGKRSQSKPASSSGCFQVEFADTSVVITEPYFNFSSIQESMNEILFEEYQFQSALRINGETDSSWQLLATYSHMCSFYS